MQHGTDQTTLEPRDHAGWGARLAAWLVDGIMVGVLALVGIIAVTTLVLVIAPGADDGPDDDMFALAWVATWLLVWAIWDVAWVRSRGMGKPGQRLCGFRVVQADTLARVTLGRAVGRSVTKLVLNAVGWGIAAVVSAVTIAVEPRRRAVHDLLTGTACVRTEVLRTRGLFMDDGPVNPLERTGSTPHHAPHAPPTPASDDASSHRGPFL